MLGQRFQQAALLVAYGPKVARSDSGEAEQGGVAVGAIGAGGDGPGRAVTTEHQRVIGVPRSGQADRLEIGRRPGDDAGEDRLRVGVGAGDLGPGAAVPMESQRIALRPAVADAG